jgi:hypothetical protein
LTHRIRLRVNLILRVFCPYLPKDLKNKSLMTHFPQPSSLESKSPRFWNKGSKESWHAICDGKDLMVKMGKLVQKFE